MASNSLFLREREREREKGKRKKEEEKEGALPLRNYSLKYDDEFVKVSSELGPEIIHARPSRNLLMCKTGESSVA